MAEEEEQEIILDRSLKNIKAQAFHIRSTIDKNNLRQCLKETYQMLNELRTNKLTPKNYYHLFTASFDEMQHVSNYFKEEIRRGRRIKDLYGAVQQAKHILPRLYLLITTGAIYMESQVTAIKRIIFNLLQMVKGVQNPIRGLFTRYYLLKMIKDKLPDEGNEFETEDCNFKDTMDFILQNLDEMNRLWIRLSTTNVNETKDKQIQDKERNELKVLVGENVTRLSKLNGLKMDAYTNEVLPKLITIMIESKDTLSQQYLMECIIHAFPDEFNINCINELLTTIEKLDSNVDKRGLYVILMNKFARFVNEMASSKDNVNIEEITGKIFEPLKQSITLYIQQSSSSQDEESITKKLELKVAFIQFTVSCCSQQEIEDTVNYIFSTCLSIIKQIQTPLTSISIKQINNLLTFTLESNKLNLFEIKDFP